MKTKATKGRVSEAIDSAVKSLDAHAQSLGAKHVRDRFWSAMYGVLRKRVPKMARRDREVNMARAMVWAAIHAPQHVSFERPEALRDLLMLMGGADDAMATKFLENPIAFCEAFADAAESRRKQVTNPTPTA